MTFDEYLEAKRTGSLAPEEEAAILAEHPDWGTLADEMLGETPTGTGTGFGLPGVPSDPNVDTTTSVPLYRGWSYTDRYGFEQAVEWLGNHSDVSGLSSTLIDAFLNEWALKWRSEQGFASTEEISAVPTLAELMRDERFISGVFWLPATASGALPPVFRTSQAVTDKDGNPTGEEVALLAMPDPLTGVKFIEEKTATGTDITGGSVVTNRDVVNAMVLAQLPATFNQTVEEKTGETDMAHFLEKRGLMPGSEDLQTSVPIIPMDQLVQLVTPEAPSGSDGSSGTSRDIVFDRNHLIAQVSDLYNNWFLRPGEAPKGIVGNIVDRYIREAKSFWAGKGGQLDFDTYVRDALRELPRWNAIYRDKTPQQSEEEFLASFAQPIAGLGLDAETTRAQTFAAVSSGGSPASQLQRVSRSEEAERIGAGNFAQRLANTLKGLGPGVSA